MTPQMDGMPTRSDLMNRALKSRARLVVEAKRYLANQADAEDVVQELFLVLSGFDGSPPRNPEAWFVQVVKRRALDCLRRKINRKLALDSTSFPEPLASPTLDDVQSALQRLEEPYRSAIRLRYLEGQSFAEVASALESQERTARTWVSRGLAALREKLGGRTP